MNPPADETTDTFEEMVFALAHHDQPTLAFVECNSLAKRDEIEQQLGQRLPEYQFYTLDVTPYPVVSLLRLLQEQLPAAVRESEPVSYVVHVHGLENSLLVSEQGQLVPSALTRQLNLERELLFRSVPFILILWGDAHFFRTLQREAPDLCHWVTYKFRFEDHAARPAELLPPLPPQRLPQRGNVTEREARIRELEERYNRLALDDSDKKRLLKDKISILSLLAEEHEEAFAYGKAAEAYRNAIALQEIIHATAEEQSRLRFNLGSVYLKQRAFSAALKSYEQSKALTVEQNYGAIYHQIGRLYQQQRQWAAALENYDLSLKWDIQTGNNSELGGTYHQIGMVCEEQHQWAAALENYGLALKWKQQTGNTFELGNTYHQIGMVHEEQQQWAAALENYGLALKWQEQTGNHFELGSTYHQIGNVYATQRQWEAALENYWQALKWNEQTGNQFELGGNYHQIGYIYENKDMLLEAQAWFEKAVFNLRQYNHPNPSLAEESLARVKKRLPQAAG